MLCKCGEISVDGGSSLKCFARNWNNFIRVDDNGNEIIVKVKNNDTKPKEIDSTRPNKKELLAMLDEMIKNTENLPQSAMTSPITHYDFASALLLLSSILRAEDDA